MGKKIAEWYIRNKSKILLIAFIALVIIVINIILQLVIKFGKDEEPVQEESYGLEDIINNNFNTIKMESADSVLSGEELSSYQITMAGTIEQFVDYCNTKKVNEAYNMLTEECKQELYSTVESFTNLYYNKVFNGNIKKVNVENWMGNIYKVEYTPDFLATGVYSEDNTIQDYIHVIQGDDGQYKLDINSYLGRKEINKTGENDYVSITVLRSDTYMDYQTYTFSITNKTSEEIIIDDRVYTDSMYIEDENGIQYGSYSQEISAPELTFSQNETKQVTIKYYNKYSSEKNIKKIAFLRIAPNWTQTNTNNYENQNRYKKLEIEL